MRKNSLLHLQQGGNIDDEEKNAIRGGSNNNLDAMITLEEVETSETDVPPVSIESTNGNNSTDITESLSLPDFVVQIIDTFVSIKEKVYGIIRQILGDLVTIIKRSATKARDWAVEDNVGQLVSSGLAVVGFYVFVAAFAAWNIELLSGGKSKWSGPKNGVTVPVVKGLPNGSSSEVESPVVVRFQKPKWKAPKIQTSYSNDDKASNSKEEISEILGSESFTR